MKSIYAPKTGVTKCYGGTLLSSDDDWQSQMTAVATEVLVEDLANLLIKILSSKLNIFNFKK